jgi:hypothetical protein
LSRLGTGEIVRIVETALPFLMNIRKNREKTDVVRNHELFHYFHVIQSQKIYSMDPETQKIFFKIAEDYISAFRSLLEEPTRVVLSYEYWEEFLKARQKLIPVDRTIEEEFFHLEKLIFQSIKDEVFKDKYEFIYFILTLYLLYLKIIVDMEIKKN